jgi:hypothetical protein
MTDFKIRTENRLLSSKKKVLKIQVNVAKYVLECQQVFFKHGCFFPIMTGDTI